MTRYIRHAAAFSLLLLIALLVNLTRIQVLDAPSYNANPANGRTTMSRYARARGDVYAGRTRLTGSVRTGGTLAWQRAYTAGPVFAPVTGYASQAYGTTLLENAGDPVLSGTDPALSAAPLWNAVTRRPVRGGRVVSTVDPAAQRAAYRALGGRTGAVAALDPSTGRILALVSTPSYDPAEVAGDGRGALAAWRRLTTDPRQPMLNRAIRQTYPPGSTFTVVTAAAALDSGAVTGPDAATDSPDPYTPPGTGDRLADRTPRCRDATVRYAFEAGCDTVFARLGVRVGLPGMVGAARAFGFDDPGTSIPSHVSESVFDTSMNDARLARSCVGQDDTRATPLQMAMVAAAVADGGTVMAPYLIDRETDATGRTVRTTRPRPLGRAMSGRTAAVLADLMAGAVTDGTGTGAAVPGARVGGTSGTARTGTGGRGTPYAWYVSWARPARAATVPVAVAVVVEDTATARTGASGGGSAAPVARAVMKAALGGGG
ncbi:penicillin-binding transpeptidase domain-containing protein [Streptomyces sp. SL13]|uniref:Penicillin-binding transpeptidase domain-containing protein n=1 Tax=Streptantibioticus silvisoli TaxID=2705255 RepID=A0AA90KJM2_9ACTN|nr:penicillin-binding transpeptidase domain-containing protein [Streptantibioticus silvisoli]MDI5973664.1 penicillin-binding transpeptidase domain-containing protein [Streptantibioticus silvisoli]